MIIIGEKINASRKSIAKAILSRDSAIITQGIEKQDQAGSHYIDLNAGAGRGDTEKEIKDMQWLIDLALETTEKPLSIDSPEPMIIKKAVEYLDGKRSFMINSIKNDKHILDVLMPLAAENNSPVISLAMSGDEIPDNVEKRLDNCKAIYEEACKSGVPDENLFFDPLVMPISSKYDNGRLTLETLRAIKVTFPKARTTMGTSNVSFGLPKRSKINEAFLIAAIAHGVDSAICDPTKDGMRKAILLGKLVSGKDRHCRGYTRAARRGDFDDPAK